MDSEVGITIIKRFTYRGASEEWSNQYWFSGAKPESSTGWATLAGDLADLERNILPPTVVQLRWLAYDETPQPPDHPVKPFPVNVAGGDFASGGQAGTLAETTAMAIPQGDAAAWIKWRLARRTENGKPIYLRKYYHGVPVVAHSYTAAEDEVAPAWRSAAGTFAAALQTPDALGYTLVDKYHADDEITGHDSSEFITVRTLRRRSKRNPS